MDELTVLQDIYGVIIDFGTYMESISTAVNAQAWCIRRLEYLMLAILAFQVLELGFRCWTIVRPRAFKEMQV